METSPGVVFLFTHTEFQGYESRQGSSKDVDCIQECFSRLGFQLTHHVNYTTEAVMNTLLEASRSDYSNYKCVMIIILSHFPSIGAILSKDGSYSENSVIEKFTLSKNTSLLGKPKLFFFQASRGIKIKIESDIEVDATPFTEITPLPGLSEVFILRSIYDRTKKTQGKKQEPTNAVEGSWFIKTLCKHLEDYSKTENFQDIITKVMDVTKQDATNTAGPFTRLPEITSTLTVPFKFEGCKQTCDSGSINLQTYKKYPKMGRLYIFAFTNIFDDVYGEMCNRNCARDVQNLEEIFLLLGFSVEIHVDVRKDFILHKLREESNYKDDTCVAVAFITHAVDDMLGTSNYPFHEDELYHCFTDSIHPDLKGKPKFFIIQTCVRTDVFNALEVVHVKPTKRLPLEESDILVIYIHQVNSYVSRTCNNRDSFMIETLCSQIKQATLQSEVSIMNIIVGFQATMLKYITDSGSKAIGSRNRQLPYICSTLTKKLLLGPQSVIKHQT